MITIDTYLDYIKISGEVLACAISIDGNSTQNVYKATITGELVTVYTHISGNLIDGDLKISTKNYGLKSIMMSDENMVILCYTLNKGTKDNA